MKRLLRISVAFGQKMTLVGILVSMSACSGGSSSDGAISVGVSPPPPPPPPPPSVRLFSDVTAQSGIQFTTGFINPISNGEIPRIVAHGVASGDYDNDGDIDLLVVRGDIGPNLLYRNDGAMVFVDVAAEAGLAFTKSANENYRHGSPVFADMDGDGNLDVILPGLESDPSMVYRNNGDGTFSDVSAGSGIDTITALYSFSPALGDYDLDGDLDLMLGHWGTPRDFTNPGDTQHLWRNDSDENGIKFTSVTVSAGLSPSIVMNDDPFVAERVFDNSFTPTFARIDDDIYPDILLASDFNTSQYFKNNGDGTFSNVTNYNVIIDGNGMGAAVGDYDNDGDLDWFVSSIKAVDVEQGMNLSEIGNRLYQNNSGSFTDVTDEAGVADGGWGWGSCFVDLDNNGRLDIYHTNGWDTLEQFGGFPTDKSRVFLSRGDGTFVEDAERLGLDDNEQGRGVVCADFDNDGDVDILQLQLNNQNAATLWKNTTDSKANYLGVNLNGLPPNTKGVGARIHVSSGGRNQIRDVLIGSNFASHNPTEQIFGLGGGSVEATIIVDWPDGKQSTMSGVSLNQKLTISHPDL